MSWFETALAMATRTTLEVTVKNTVAQVLKEFYGYGPRTAVRCMVQGPLILYAARPGGSISLDELAVRAAGHVVMHYNNQLLLSRYRDQLVTLAQQALNNRLIAVFCDFDPPGRLIVAGSLLTRPLNRDSHPANAPVARAMRCAVAAMGGPVPAEVVTGPESFWTRLPSPGWVPDARADDAPDGTDPMVILSGMARWRAWRDQCADRLRQECRAAGVELAAAFVGQDQGELLLGGLLDTSPAQGYHQG